MSIGGHYRYRDILISALQWRLISALEPGWLFVDRKFAHARTWSTLLDRKWIEVRKREDYYLVRLTKMGLEIRDAVHRKRACELNWRLWGTSWKWRKS